MNPRQFNGIFRPLVKSAWEAYCLKTGTSPNKKDLYRMWYEQHLREATNGRLVSTKDSSSKDMRRIVDYFQALVAPAGRIPIKTWTESQISRFTDLAKAAHQAAKLDGETANLIDFVENCFRRHKLHQDDSGTWDPRDRKESFDHIMADLAVQAADEYWINRTSEAGERRMRWQIQQFLVDLDFLDKRFHHTWDYVRSIYKQADLLPADIEDCPAIILWKVMQMVDTHVRRFCEDFGIRPMDLPTRAHPHAHLTINEQARHLHVGHELEHLPELVHITDDSDAVPF